MHLHVYISICSRVRTRKHAHTHIIEPCLDQDPQEKSHRWRHKPMILKGIVYSNNTVRISHLLTSLVAQWLRICLPMQGTRIPALVWEDPTCRGATKPVHHNYWACALEPASHNYWSPQAPTTEARVPRARAPQQKKPPQWEAHAPQRRVAPAHRN